MSDRALFAPLARIEASEHAWEWALDTLMEEFEAGEFTPCPKCSLTVEGDQLADMTPCDDHVWARAAEEEEAAAERHAEAVMEDRAYEADHYYSNSY